MVELIVTADDLGISEGINRGVLDAHARGVVTAASLMANGRALRHAVDAAADLPDLALGAHVVLVGEDPPLLTHAEVPTLVDRSGALPASWRHLSARVLAGRVDPADVRAEARAQLDHLRTGCGLHLSHLNTHQHVHLLPLVARVVVNLAVEHGIGYLRAPTSRRRSPQAAVIRSWRRSLVAVADRAGVATPDAFAGLDEAGGLTQDDVLVAVRRSTGRARRLEITCHPGLPTPADRERYRWDYGWEGEVRALTDPGLREALTRAGAVLARPGR
ncbi:carbohydrate deacetylase [Cellulomonas sp. NPDC058312]|uniref:carbohydrate deacetylase n=1 Tax=Cellulomonas sp. NPDC058312 TaxID=3346441 RepID=UPI0036E28A12